MSTFSSTRSALIAIAAADPAPAEVRPVLEGRRRTLKSSTPFNLRSAGGQQLCGWHPIP